MAAVAGTAFVAGRRDGRGAGPPRERLTIPELAARREADRRAEITGGERNGSRGAGRGSGGSGGLPGRDADSPTEIPAAGWKQILKRAWAEQKKDNVGLLAAGVAYYAFTALFPALIAAVTLYGLFADPSQVQEQVSRLSDSMPQETRTLLTNQLTSITSTSSGALGVGLVVSILGALFTASGGVSNIIKAVNVAYNEQETRGFVKLRGLALALTLGAIVFVLVAIGLIAVLPVVLNNLALGSFAFVITNVLRFAALVLFMLLALAVLYRYAPDRDAPKFRWVGLGAVVSTALWVLGSIGLSLYVSNFGSYGKTYGALAGVIVLLLWLYITAYIVLLGAEINSESEQQTERDSTTGPEVPMGSRDAVKADTVAS